MPTGAKPPLMPTTLAIAAQLRALRALRQTTGQRMGAVAGISASQVNRVLAGKRAANTDELAGLCRSVGTSMTEVVRAAEQMVRSSATDHVDVLVEHVTGRGDEVAEQGA